MIDCDGDRLAAWHEAIAERPEMIIEEFEFSGGWLPNRIIWRSNRTGEQYITTYTVLMNSSGGMAGLVTSPTRTTSSVFDFRADVYIRPSDQPIDILTAIMNRTSDYVGPL